MSSTTAPSEPISFAARVMRAVAWRSGSQIGAQIIMWSSTFFVIRLLDPADYGLFAMTQSVLVLFSLLNGQGFAAALVRAEAITEQQIRQVFGLLIILNLAVALLQFALAPWAAAYFHHPVLVPMLRVQTLLYLANPLIVLPVALLGRAMDFHRQAKVNLLSAAVGASTALLGALAGFGVWTLVAAPLAMIWTRAIGMTIAARLLVWPSFNFVGAGSTVKFGGAMLLSSFLWLIQTQADVYIGGRVLTASQLGLYTTALFLAQIVTSKFIPPLNEVAFTAYARLQGGSDDAARAFEKSTRIIMLLALPFYFGLAATAEPFVLTMLGDKWAATIPVIILLSLTMPLLTLQILFTPATTALGHARIQVVSAAAGAVVMPLAFVWGVGHGPVGMAWAWLVGCPILTAFTAAIAMPVIGSTPGALFRAIAPAVIAASGMAVVVLAIDAGTGLSAAPLRLALLVTVGILAYVGLVWLVARPMLDELRALWPRFGGRSRS